MSDPSAGTTMNLDHLAYLVVSGNDATKFLHAQFTNDLESLPVMHWQYTGYCTPKGRLLAFMIALKRAENDYLLILDSSVLEKFQPRLTMFVMRDDVSIQAGNGTVLGAIDVLPADWNVDQPPETGEALSAGDNCLLTIDEQRWMYIDASGSDSGTAKDADEWIRQDILAGIPAVSEATHESFVPQMTNMDLIGAVNFKKGCYPGQEVVARVHYLGRIKQRMFRASVDATDVKAGDAIYSEDQDSKAAGTVVSAANDSQGTMLLAVLQTSAIIEGKSLHLGGPGGPQLTIQELPYAIPDLTAEADESVEKEESEV